MLCISNGKQLNFRRVNFDNFSRAFISSLIQKEMFAFSTLPRVYIHDYITAVWVENHKSEDFHVKTVLSQ